MRNGVILFVCFVMLGLTGCDKEKEVPPVYDLYFAQKEFHGQLGSSFSISVNGGNKDYSITPAHPELLTYKLDMEGAGLGRIDVTPLKKGSTTIRVKDNVTLQEETLKIDITDKYLYLSMYHLAPEQPQIKLSSTDPDLQQRIADRMKADLTEESRVFVLLNNEKKSFYRIDVAGESAYKETGHYRFEKEDERCFLIFYPSVHGDGTPKEVYEFDTSRVFKGFSFLTNYFEIDWVTRSDFVPPYLYLKRDLTADLKEEFPTLESARWAMQGEVGTGGRIPLEWFD